MHLNNLKNYDVCLSKNTIDLILGSILGDGSLILKKNYLNAVFMIKQSTLKYLKWKLELIDPILGKTISENKSDGSRYTQNLSWVYQSKANEQLSKIYNFTRSKGVKVIKRTWLNMMSPLSLAIWWLDDGSIIGNGRKGRFCTHSFSEETHKILKRYLQVVWGIQSSLRKTSLNPKTKKVYSSLELDTTNLKKLIELILPYLESLPLQMWHKCILLYKDQDCQQRWISTIIEKSKISKSIIEQALMIKKNRWKAYVEKDIVQSL